jgi:hypothetical protein
VCDRIVNNNLNNHVCDPEVNKKLHKHVCDCKVNNYLHKHACDHKVHTNLHRVKGSFYVRTHDSLNHYFRVNNDEVAFLCV